MPTVKFTYALRRFFPNLKDTQASGRILSEVFQEMEGQYPGVCSYLLNEQGALRQHVNIFIDANIITDRSSLNHVCSEHSEIFIMQALSGG